MSKQFITISATLGGDFDYEDYTINVDSIRYLDYGAKKLYCGDKVFRLYYKDVAGVKAALEAISNNNGSGVSEDTLPKEETKAK